MGEVEHTWINKYKRLVKEKWASALKHGPGDCAMVECTFHVSTKTEFRSPEPKQMPCRPCGLTLIPDYKETVDSLNETSHIFKHWLYLRCWPQCKNMEEWWRMVLDTNLGPLHSYVPTHMCIHTYTYMHMDNTHIYTQVYARAHIHKWKKKIK